MAKKKKVVAASEEEKDYKKEIKEMERKKREEALKKAKVAPAASEEEVSFDQWYMMRASSIPGIHRKEILKADFKGRGLGDKAAAEKYDEALEKYGVKLKK